VTGWGRIVNHANFGGEDLENHLPGKPRSISEGNMNINFRSTVLRVSGEWIKIM
jgi:hypothetical protein